MSLTLRRIDTAGAGRQWVAWSGKGTFSYSKVYGFGKNGNKYYNTKSQLERAMKGFKSGSRDRLERIKNRKKTKIKNRWVKTKTLGSSTFKNTNRKARYMIKDVYKSFTVYYKTLAAYRAGNGKKYYKK